MQKTIFVIIVLLLMNSCIREFNPVIIDVKKSYLSGQGYLSLMRAISDRAMVLFHSFPMIH